LRKGILERSDDYVTIQKQIKHPTLSRIKDTV
jgi:hypothetical protein